MKRITRRGRLRAGHIALLASVLAHVAVLAAWTPQRHDPPRPDAVLIEFAPSARPEIPTVVTPERPKTDGIAAVDPGGGGADPARTPEAATPSKPLRTGLLAAVLAVDLSSLRQTVVSVEATRSSQRIQTAGVTLAEPDIHLTAIQVDSTLAADTEDSDIRRKKGFRTQHRGVSGCLP